MTQPAADGKLNAAPGKSGCPINAAVELLGDRWSLIILRDIMFSTNIHFRELLSASVEGIASNILASRLAKLTSAGLLTRDNDPAHRQKIEYHLTEASIQLVPVIAHLGAWGAHWLHTTPELTIRAELLAAGGPSLWERFMDELRTIHLTRTPGPANGVLAELTAAYERQQREARAS